MTLYTVNEIAAILKLHRANVYALARSGKLAHSRIGRSGKSIRFTEADIAAYLASTRVGDKTPKRTTVVHVPDLMRD